MIWRYVFPSVGSSGATSRCLHHTWPLTQLFRRYAPTHRWIIRCWRPRGQNLSGSFHATVGWTVADPSVHPVLLHESWRVSVLFELDHQIDRRFLPMDHRFIQRYCLLFFSATRPTLLENRPSIHPMVPWFSPVYQLVRPLHRRLLSRYRRFIRRCHFFFFSFLFLLSRYRRFIRQCPFLSFLLNLACGIFASLGSENVYKDMLNNMVSLIDHVVMNHQNQTRTNGIWGHVRYNTNNWLVMYRI
jgi:hypothetical protein